MNSLFLFAVLLIPLPKHAPEPACESVCAKLPGLLLDTVGSGDEGRVLVWFDADTHGVIWAKCYLCPELHCRRGVWVRKWTHSPGDCYWIEKVTE